MVLHNLAYQICSYEWLIMLLNNVLPSLKATIRPYLRNNASLIVF